MGEHSGTVDARVAAHPFSTTQIFCEEDSGHSIRVSPIKNYSLTDASKRILCCSAAISESEIVREKLQKSVPIVACARPPQVILKTTHKQRIKRYFSII
jgi:hypothetical protein